MHTAKTQYDQKIELKSRQVKRRYQRKDVADFIGDLSDGKRIFGGMVENISTGGFEMTDLPNSFSSEKYAYDVVLSGGGSHFKMLVKPCWRKKKSENTTAVGFKILDASWQWVAFTLNQFPAHNSN